MNKKRFPLILSLTVAGLLAVVSFSSCKKDKNCRCSVRGSQEVRTIKVAKGTCEDLNYVQYQDPVHINFSKVDTILCEEMK